MLQHAAIIHAAILNVEILPANAVCFIDFGSVLNCLLSIFHWVCFESSVNYLDVTHQECVCVCLFHFWVICYHCEYQEQGMNGIQKLQVIFLKYFFYLSFSLTYLLIIQYISGDDFLFNWKIKVRNNHCFRNDLIVCTCIWHVIIKSSHNLKFWAFRFCCIDKYFNLIAWCNLYWAPTSHNQDGIKFFTLFNFCKNVH